MFKYRITYRNQQGLEQSGTVTLDSLAHYVTILEGNGYYLVSCELLEVFTHF